MTFAISSVVLVLAGVLLVQQASDEIIETKKNSAIAEATGIYNFMQTQLRSSEVRSAAVYDQLSKLADQAGAQAGQFRVALQGPVSSVSTGIEWQSVPQELREQVASGDGMYVTPTQIVYTDPDRSPEPAWVVGANLIDVTGQRIAVYYLFPMTNEVATLVALRSAVITTGLALLVALGLIAAVVTIQVVRPVQRASRTALKLASGDLDERMEVRGTDDLASLAESMNEMAADLQSRIDELEALSSVQRRFVSDVSHELRTPMTTIKMANDVLYESRADFDPQSARTAELMHDEIDRFDRLLSDLLEISRFDAGAAVLSLEDTDFAQLVSSEVDGVRAFAESQSVELRLHGSQQALAQLDPGRIRRLLRNLLTNAIEHGEGKPIDITVAADDEAVAVTVRDHGVGFEAEQSRQVFDRFWRADPSRTRVVGGSGLGLSIALEDARLHRGWLTAWGRLGQGAQFRLTLPRTPTDDLTTSPLPVIPTDYEARVGG